MATQDINIGDIIDDVREQLDSLWKEDYSDEYEWEEWVRDQFNQLSRLDVNDEAELMECHCGGTIMVTSHRYKITVDEAKIITYEVIKEEAIRLNLDGLFEGED